MTEVSLSGGDKLEAKLAEIANQIGRGGAVRVGFLEGATYPDGTPVAMVAALLNFGIANGKAWPFFTNMIEEKAPGWGKTLADLLRANDYDVPAALALMGTGIAGQLRQSIVDTNEPALEPSTIAAKGFDKPLVDTGHMLNSIDYEVTDE